MKKPNEMVDPAPIRSSKSAMGILFLALTLAFMVSCKWIFPVTYKTLSGSHIWLSASTIKFVNHWLSESPQELHFVNFESPDSIEFNSSVERGPYISYPSGETFFVYCFAKLAGHSRIDLSFLKHLQLWCFWSEILLFALFVYRFLSRNGVASEMEKTITAFSTALFWSWLPANTWYLENVFFADQCIILFVMAFLLVEYEGMHCTRKTCRFTINAAKSLLIFAGVMIDYYFWILAFVAFIMHLLRTMRAKEGWANLVSQSLWYVVPVIVALTAFACQLMSIPNWDNLLADRFFLRAGLSPCEDNALRGILINLKIHFTSSFGLTKSGFLRSLVLFAVLVFELGMGTMKNTCRRILSRFPKWVFGKNGTIIVLGFVSPLLQIALLRNHSAMHEFSMLKLAWCVAMVPVLVPLMLLRAKGFSRQCFAGNAKYSFFFHGFVLCMGAMIVITNIPFSSRDFYLSRQQYSSHLEHSRIAEILRNNTSREHVCFSFSVEIPENPPHALAISGKRVYKINALKELDAHFPNLALGAKKLLVIDKNATDLTNEQLAEQRMLVSDKPVFYEDDWFCLLLLE